MTTSNGTRQGTWGRALAAALVLLAVVGPVLSTPVALGREPDEVFRMDLAATMLTPNDAEAAGLDGLLIGNGRTFTSLTDAMSAPAFAESRGRILLRARSDAVHQLEDAGWQRFHERIIARPIAEGSSDFTLSVTSGVEVFANAEGAADAFAFFAEQEIFEAAIRPDSDELDGAHGIGDESRLWHLPKTGAAAEGLTLWVRLDNMIASVAVTDYTGGEPSVETIEALAERLLERIETVQDDGAIGLSLRILRMSGGAVIPGWDTYELTRGDASPRLGEPTDDFEQRREEAEAYDRSDTYYVFQRLETGADGTEDNRSYTGRVSRYESVEAAVSYFDDLGDLLESDKTLEDLEFLADAPDYGDDSLAYTFDVEGPDGTVRRNVAVALRVGADVASMRISDADTPPLAVVEPLALAQLDCLGTGICPDPIPVPAETMGATAVTGDIAPVEMAGGDAARTGIQAGPGPAGEPTLLWRHRSVGVGASPIVVDGTIYTSSGLGLLALDAATGVQLWSYRLPGYALSSAPAYADGMVFVAGAEAAVYAVDAETGEEVWAFTDADAGDELVHVQDLVVANGIVYASNDAGQLIALDEDTGEEEWRYEAAGKRFSAPAVADGIVVVNTGPQHEGRHRLFALDAGDGTVKWRLRLDEGEGDPAGPAIAGGIVFAGSVAGTFFAADAESGEELWSAPLGVKLFWAPAVSDGTAYVLNSSNELFALDTERGEERWRFSPEGRIEGTPVLVDDTLYIGGLVVNPNAASAAEHDDGALYALDAETGQLRWRFATVGQLHDIPSVTGGAVFVQDLEAGLTAITGVAGD